MVRYRNEFGNFLPQRNENLKQEINFPTNDSEINEDLKQERNFSTYNSEINEDLKQERKYSTSLESKGGALTISKITM